MVITQDILTVLEEILNSFRGFLIINKQGNIVLITRNYAQFLGFSDHCALIGRPVTEVIPDTKMLDVMQSGQPDIADVWNIHGETLVVNRLPLIIDGEIVGAIAFDVFRDTRQAWEFSRRFLNPLSQSPAPHTWKSRYSLKNLIGQSPALARVRQQVSLMASIDSPVLITGETGTGKELVAHSLHSESNRSPGPFVQVNCASIPENLWESELFGYEDGAFTGARRGGKAGKIEIADQGTLFLDEVGEMPLAGQAKLLRVLQDMEVDRLGSNCLRPVDVRIVAATNRNLEEYMHQGRFREDLYYRLAVFQIHLPPLRERREDIACLAQHFLQKANYHLGCDVTGVSNEAVALLERYPWPGNARELYSTLERAVLIQQQGWIDTAAILEARPDLEADTQPYDPEPPTLRENMRDQERLAIMEALRDANGNRTVAARLLGIHRSSLYYKMKELGINPTDVLKFRQTQQLMS